MDFHIIKLPLTFENTRPRKGNRGIGINAPIILTKTEFSKNVNIEEDNEAYQKGGYSGLPMHFKITRSAGEDGYYYNADIYECRPLNYQNGFADADRITLNDEVKNSIVVQIESDNTITFNAENNVSIKDALVNLCAYICQHEFLNPMTDIVDFSEIFCDSDRTLSESSIQDLKESVMQKLYPDLHNNWTYISQNHFGCLVIPNIEAKKRTLLHLAKISMKSLDFKMWYPCLSCIIKANVELIDALSNQNPSMTIEEICLVPLRPTTLIITPPTPYIYDIEARRQQMQADSGSKETARLNEITMMSTLESNYNS